MRRGPSKKLGLPDGWFIIFTIETGCFKVSIMSGRMLAKGGWYPCYQWVIVQIKASPFAIVFTFLNFKEPGRRADLFQKKQGSCWSPIKSSQVWEGFKHNLFLLEMMACSTCLLVMFQGDMNFANGFSAYWIRYIFFKGGETGSFFDNTVVFVRNQLQLSSVSTTISGEYWERIRNCTCSPLGKGCKKKKCGNLLCVPKNRGLRDAFSFWKGMIFRLFSCARYVVIRSARIQKQLVQLQKEIEGHREGKRCKLEDAFPFEIVPF